MIEKKQIKPPHMCWWVVNGEELMDKLREAQTRYPEVIYMEMVDESEVEE